MSIVRLQNVQVGFGTQMVLEELDWEIQRGEKVGLVGPNGSGKTTLFKLILGQIKPSIGTVTAARGLQVAYLPQEPTLDSDNTLLAEVTRTFDHVRELEQRVAEVAQLISEHHETEQAADLMEEYDELTHRLEAAGGYDFEVKVKEVLGGLGFGPQDYELPVNALSGGQKCRAALAEILLQEADLLLLDEPTNHLDIEATRFLERFLAGYHGAAVIVSHDRYLLDRVVDKTADLDERRINVYPCAYSDYAESKRVRQLTREREFIRQQEWIHKQKEYAERVKADKRRSRQARGRLRAIERLEDQGKLVAPPAVTRRKMALQFKPARRAGDMVLKAEGLRKAYGDVVLFDQFNLEIYRGEKIGIIGPNGVGKTTLLKMALGRIAPDAGLIRLYENLAVGYYDQEHAGLNPESNVLEAVDPAVTGPGIGELRSFVARFLFQGDDVFKRVGSLSGGEQSRVVLAGLMWRNPQVLVLDEPTNHLDIPGKEVLEDALIAYEGAVLLISHDRYFLDRVVNKLLVLPARGRYELMDGNWSSYEQRLALEEARQRAEQEAARREARRVSKTVRKSGGNAADAEEAGPYAGWSIDEIESAIIAREKELSWMEARFADPRLYQDAQQARTLRIEAERLRTELAALNAAWESLAS